jgi:hypothetical protein
LKKILEKKILEKKFLKKKFLKSLSLLPRNQTQKLAKLWPDPEIIPITFKELFVYD